MIVHHYKLFISKWFISIRIFGNIYDYDEYIQERNPIDKESIIQICDSVYICFAPEPNDNVGPDDSYNQMHTDDYSYLIEGLKKVGEKIKENSPYTNTVIQITRLEYNHCFYQAEGLFAGIMEWAAKAFDFECPKIDVSFDRDNNSYVYRL